MWLHAYMHNWSAKDGAWNHARWCNRLRQADWTHSPRHLPLLLPGRGWLTPAGLLQLLFAAIAVWIAALTAAAMPLDLGAPLLSLLPRRNTACAPQDEGTVQIC
jgi:hypothetical protein